MRRTVVDQTVFQKYLLNDSIEFSGHYETVSFAFTMHRINLAVAHRLCAGDAHHAQGSASADRGQEVALVPTLFDA